MKKTLLVVLALFTVCVGVFAKGSSEGGAKKTYTFGYIAYDMTDIWNEYSARAFEYAAKQMDNPVKVIILDSKNILEE